jgi:hypothetical protein
MVNIGFFIQIFVSRSCIFGFYNHHLHILLLVIALWLNMSDTHKSILLFQPSMHFSLAREKEGTRNLFVALAHMVASFRSH